MPCLKNKKKEKQLKDTCNMFPANTVLSVVSATHLGICKGELLKFLELRILVLSQLNDLCPEYRDLAEPAKHEGWLLSKNEAGGPCSWDRPCSIYGSSGRAHVQSISDFQKSICHGTIMTSFITRDWCFSSHFL